MLHGHAVEIVSPSFMVQRPIATGHKIIPEQPVRHQQPREMSVAPEERIFDKAEEAANLEQSREQLELVKASIKELRASTRGADEATRADLDFQIEQITAKQHWLEASIERLQEN